MPKQRLSIYVGDELIERLALVKDKINISRVCAEALEREIERAEASAKRDEYKTGQSDYLDTLKRAPLLVNETLLDYPPDIARKVAKMPPYRAEGHREGWVDAAGTVNPWSYRPTLADE